ncbi:CPBP family intramembrane metalloprotease [Candidatus Dojkabacteria bacterium]|nr:CPBP family intramembrane metalloprotease [Candidatus Dojkabacteria bacterium]
MQTNYFQIKQIYFLLPEIQLVLITLLFILTAYFKYLQIKKGLAKDTSNSINMQCIFAPIYEEIIFRGIIFGGLLYTFSFTKSLIISSALFGIWHFKNIFTQKNKRKLLFQILTTGIFYGPIFALITYHTGSIWVSVMIHYLNNLFFFIPFKLKVKGKTINELYV